MKKTELKPIQEKAISLMLEGLSIEKLCKEIGISRPTWYNWLEHEDFKNRLDKERKVLWDESLSLLKTAVGKAVTKLSELLDSRNENQRRLSAKAILDLSFKIVEVQELEERVTQLEDALEQDKGSNKRV